MIRRSLDLGEGGLCRVSFPKKKAPDFSGAFRSGPREIRTPDPLTKSNRQGITGANVVQKMPMKSGPATRPLALSCTSLAWLHGQIADRAAALNHHPDRGGVHDAMIAVIEARDFLSRVLGGAA